MLASVLSSGRKAINGSQVGELLDRQFAVIQQDDLWDWSNAKKK
jgi:hypothetical protein